MFPIKLKACIKAKVRKLLANKCSKTSSFLSTNSNSFLNADSNSLAFCFLNQCDSIYKLSYSVGIIWHSLRLTTDHYCILYSNRYI